MDLGAAMVLSIMGIRIKIALVFFALCCPMASVWAGDIIAGEATPKIVFAPGNGTASQDGPVPNGRVYEIARSPDRPSANAVDQDCNNFILTAENLLAPYHGAPLRLADSKIMDGVTLAWPAQRLDGTLLAAALSSYTQHICGDDRTRRSGQGQSGEGLSGPGQIVVVDFAKNAKEPRLYRIDLRSGDGLDKPILVAHGKGSDPNDDGYPDVFSNINDSLMSSLGAARGGAIYSGKNGRSLKLDGLDRSNSLFRFRNIVVHSYRNADRGYFGASNLARRSGVPSTSEGCFVVEPQLRDWMLASLENGGFLYAGIGKTDRPIRVLDAMPITPPVAPSAPIQNGSVIFAKGTGAGTGT